MELELDDFSNELANQLVASWLVDHHLLHCCQLGYRHRLIWLLHDYYLCVCMWTISVLLNVVTLIAVHVFLRYILFCGVMEHVVKSCVFRCITTSLLATDLGSVQYFSACICCTVYVVDFCTSASLRPMLNRVYGLSMCPCVCVHPKVCAHNTL